MGGVGKTCDKVGSDGLSCCGAEHGPGFAFCQISEEYQCCSGATYAISCSSKAGCSVTDAGIPVCQNDTVLQSVATDDDVCPGVGKTCDKVGSDGLSCCGAEHGPGFAFCQISEEYQCCSGASYAISCSSKAGCSVTDAGIPVCQNDTALQSEGITTDDDVCPGVGKTCDKVGSDGLSCCGAEHGPGFAFCQISEEYQCCSGASYAISCSSKAGCSVTDAGIPVCQNNTLLEPKVELEIAQAVETGADFVCHGLNYNITCGPQYTACCGENTIAPLCMDAAGHSCCKDEDLNLAVTCEKGQKCNKGPQCTAGSMMV